MCEKFMKEFGAKFRARTGLNALPVFYFGIYWRSLAVIYLQCLKFSLLFYDKFWRSCVDKITNEKSRNPPNLKKEETS